MASLHRVAANTLRASARPALSRRTPALKRWESSASTEVPRSTSAEDAPGGRPGAGQEGGQSLVRKEGASEGQPRHQPDYNVAADYRASTFSPIPKRVMDGSEEGSSVAAAVLSGAPTDLQARTVRIFRPAKTATQSGDWHSHQWRMDWDVLSKGHRWENPLMGWQSSGDFMQGTHLNFKSKEDAVNFANKQGYEYFVQEPNERKFVPKAYATQFVHESKKLKQARTK
ncbi:NADH:ubiquinone oxidoreductase 21kD subunit [Meristemomyces frigidus]|nr:NADH:ubiquinone oxidoreductase 21kD subunit [Meristemomyces frigidus]